jgi:hypothetical protein
MCKNAWMGDDVDESCNNRPARDLAHGQLNYLAAVGRFSKGAQARVPVCCSGSALWAGGAVDLNDDTLLRSGLVLG